MRDEFIKNTKVEYKIVKEGDNFEVYKFTIFEYNNGTVVRKQSFFEESFKTFEDAENFVRQLKGE